MMNILNEILLKVNKPSRYCGGEFNCEQMKENAINYALAFPDTYEVGMSHLGMKILYSLLNSMPDVNCERVFAPLCDMAELMKQKNISLYGLESFKPLREFDFIGFSLQYEMCLTTVLYMLELSGIPLKSQLRKETDPIIMAGGSVCVNPEPFCDIFDLMLIGEAEEALPKLLKLYKENPLKSEFLKKAALLDGIYVPSFYEVSYDEHGRQEKREAHYGAPQKVKRLYIKDIDSAFYPTKMIVPFAEPVHDRVNLEVMRGCPRGCRFCQAGIIYRPVRQKSLSTVLKQADDLLNSTGYEQISLSSLSTTDYKYCTQALNGIYESHEKQKVTVSLPSLRIDAFSVELAKQMQSTRTIPLTFAPEAGSQRMRDVINKNISEEEILSTISSVFAAGYSRIKLYFMIGLPFENDEDIKAIGELLDKIANEYKKLGIKGKFPIISASVSCFVPKPHTPFEFFKQNTCAEFERKQREVLRPSVERHIKLSYHDADLSVLEGAFARGDRRLNDVLFSAYEKGCVFDSWNEHYNSEAWKEAFKENGYTIEQFASRSFDYEEPLPWDFIDIGVSKDFLIREAKKAEQATTTPNCYEKCSDCGINRENGRCNFEI